MSDTATIVVLAGVLPLTIIGVLCFLVWAYRNRKYAPCCLKSFLEKIASLIASLQKPADSEEPADPEEGAVDKKDDGRRCVCPLWCAAAWAQVCQCFSRCFSTCFAQIGKFMAEVKRGERCSNQVAKQNLKFYFPCCFQFWNWLCAKLCPKEPRQSRRGQPKTKKDTQVDCVTVELEELPCEHQITRIECSPPKNEEEAANANETEVLVHRCPSDCNLKETGEEDKPKANHLPDNLPNNLPNHAPESSGSPGPNNAPEASPEATPDLPPEPTPAPAPAPVPVPESTPAVDLSALSPDIAAVVQAAVEAALKAALANTPRQ
ncbi:Ba171 [Baboon cytomegalovirus]|nr:Ba171 [Baboon cytomegalovirus]